MDTSLTRLVADFYSRPLGRRAIAVAAFSIVGSLALVLPIADTPGVMLLAAAALIHGVVWALVPAYSALVARSMLRNGRLTTARVTSLRSGRSSRVTVDALTNGWAEGTRLVESDQPFEEPFATDAPWTSQLDIGTVLRVVTDSGGHRVLLDLGMADEAAIEPAS